MLTKSLESNFHKNSVIYSSSLQLLFYCGLKTFYIISELFISNLYAEAK